MAMLTEDDGTVNKKTAGYLVLVTALGMSFGLIGNEIKNVKDWAELFSPGFVGTTFIHMGTVIGAYVGGRITPSRD